MNKIASNARLTASLQELARFGSPVDLSAAVTAIENEKVEIEQVGGICESHIFELPDGRVAYMADVAVTNQTSRSIDLIDVELHAPWDDGLFQWLTPVEVKLRGRGKQRSSYWAYQFPGKNGLELLHAQVLNHHLLERKKLPGKNRLEGWILGIGGRMPSGLRHGQWLDIQFTIIGADHAEYSTSITLWTERLCSRTNIVKSRTSIFGRGLEEEMMLARDVAGTVPRPSGQPPADADQHAEV